MPGSFEGGQIGEFKETPGLNAGAWQMRALSPTMTIAKKGAAIIRGTARQRIAA